MLDLHDLVTAIDAELQLLAQAALGSDGAPVAADGEARAGGAPPAA